MSTIFVDENIKHIKRYSYAASLDSGN